MRERDAQNLVKLFPEWIKEWNKEASQDENLQSLHVWAIHRAKGLVSAIQWFIHCLYSRGFKIVRK